MRSGDSAMAAEFRNGQFGKDEQGMPVKSRSSGTELPFSGSGIPISRPPNPFWPLAKFQMAEHPDRRRSVSSGAPACDLERVDRVDRIGAKRCARFHASSHSSKGSRPCGDVRRSSGPRNSAGMSAFNERANSKNCSRLSGLRHGIISPVCPTIESPRYTVCHQWHSDRWKPKVVCRCHSALMKGRCERIGLTAPAMVIALRSRRA